MSEARAREDDAEALARNLLEGVERFAVKLARSGRALSDVGTPAELARRMLSALPEPTPWNERIGPVYRTSAVATLLATSRQAVDERRRRGTLLACRTADDVWVFPAFQFEGRAVRPELVRLLRMLGAEEDGWTIAAWLTAHQRSLDGRTPLTWVREHGLDERLTELAADQAARWAA